MLAAAVPVFCCTKRLQSMRIAPVISFDSLKRPAVSHKWNMGLYARKSVPSSFVSWHVVLQCAPPLPWPACLSFPAVSTGTDIQVSSAALPQVLYPAEAHYIQVASKHHCLLPGYLVFSFCCIRNCFFFYSLLSHNFTPPCLPQIG